MVVQFIWTSFNKQIYPQLQEYQDLIEKIKLTPRQWDSHQTLNELLKYLSFILSISINLIGLKRTQTQHKDNFQCGHSRPCFLPYYKFQNAHIRFCQNYRTENFFQINILQHKSNFFSISSASCNPLLINELPNFNFYHKSEPVTLQDINNILNQKPIEKSFSIALYSTSSYVRSCHSKIISKHLVGHLQNNSDDTLHLFLTPHLHSSTFDIYKLDLSTTNNIAFNIKNIYSNTHKTEGKFSHKSNSRPNKDLLNQEHCVCEHQDTKRFHAPNNKSFKPLGNLFMFNYNQ
jgi:hypothetical protein